MIRSRMDRNSEKNRRLASKVASSVFATLAAMLLLAAGARSAVGQNLPCPAQNWTASTANVWAAEGSIKVMLNNQATTNQPSIPTYLDDGNFSPWGYQQHPQPITELNPVYSCPGGTPTIALQGAGRETVSFQVFITAGLGTNAALSGVSVAVTPLAGPGTTLTSTNTNCADTSTVNPNCTQISNVNRYLEGYIPYTSGGAGSPASMQISGGMPDILIPFYDPYDSGNPAIGASFSVQPATTQAVWVDVSIPANETAGTYTGTVTVSGNGVSATIPVNLTVWGGSLPGFDAGSVNSQYGDMLQSWIVTCEGTFDGGEGVSGGTSAEVTLLQKYQVMAHDYSLDTWFDAVPTLTTPLLSSTAGYPSTDPQSFTTSTPSGPGATGTTSTINWTAYDAEVGPALTPGGLFSDGTSMRVFDTPFTGGPAGNNGAWTWGQGYNWMWGAGDGLPPAGLLQLYANYSEQISMHFTACQSTGAACGTTKPWGHPELIAYTWDEPYWYVLAGTTLVYQDIALFEQAMNQANTKLSSTWAANTNPIRSFITDEPACQTENDSMKGNYDNQVCTDHENLSYPNPSTYPSGWTGSTAANTWVMDWSDNAGIHDPGQPGPGISYWDCDVPGDPTVTTIMAGSGYKYTFDTTQGVQAKSTAPAPISQWFYQGGEPNISTDQISGSSVGLRANFWIMYKYGFDMTLPSAGDPSPAYPVPGGAWDWTDDFWNGSPGNCNGTPYSNSGSFFFYPGGQLDCYNASGALGASILPGVNLKPNGNGISGPVASMRRAQWRRGYEDYEYLYLEGKLNGRSAAETVVDSMGGGGMTSGGPGASGPMPSWQALNWEEVDPGFISGVWPLASMNPNGQSNISSCTDSSVGAGGLPNGLPNGPTGASGSYDGITCPGEWTNNPDRYAAARALLAYDLGWTTNAAPTVSSLSPPNGSTAGSTSVTITGTNLTGATEVQFGGVDATNLTNNTGTSITVTAPAGINTVDVQVFTPSGNSAPTNGSQYTYDASTITAISPISGTSQGGTSVTITGTGFTGATAVDFGGIAATNVKVNSAGTQITATAPAYPEQGSGVDSVSTVNVTVTTSSGTSAYTTSDQFTYEPAPALTAFSPTTGPAAGGTSVTLTGANLTGATAVDFGPGNPATGVSINSTGTQITAVSPPGASLAAVNVTVTTQYGTSNAETFTYGAATPTLTGIAPTSGISSTSVTLTGTNLNGATAVNFGTTSVTPTSNSSTSVVAAAPAGSGTVSVTVTTPGGTSNGESFTYTTATPALTGINPTSGPVGTPVTLTGTNLSGATAVDFGPSNPGTITTNTATSITATAPTGSGVVGVTVTTPGGTSGVEPFTYTAPTTTPTTTTLTSSASSITAGSSVTLTATVQAGSTAVTSGTVNFYNGSTLLNSTPITLNAYGVATFTTTTLPTGSDNITATYIGNSSYTTSTSSTVTITVSAAAPNFTFTTSSTTVSIAPGQTGNTTLTLTPTGGYSGTVTLSCAGQPLYTSCVFTQSGATNNVVTLSGSGPVNVTLTVDTNVAAMRAMPSPFGPQQSPLSPILPALAFWWPGSMAGLAAFGRKRGISKTQQRMLQLCLLVLMTGALAAGISGCGGYNSSNAAYVTPAGTKTMTVTATPTSGASQSVSITVTIT